MRWLTIAAVMCTSVSCTSSTLISSRPTGASVNVDGIDIGDSPAQWSSTVWAGTKNHVRLSLPGYADVMSTIAADQWSVGRVVVSVLCFLPGLLWSTDYRPSYEFTLQPTAGTIPVSPGYAPPAGYQPPPSSYGPPPYSPGSPPPSTMPPPAGPTPPPLPVR